MTIALWIVNALLALVFLAAGAMKLARPKAALIERGMGWAQGVSDTNVKLIGLAEVLGAIGLILPLAVNIAPVLTPIAAIGLAVVMNGAAETHGELPDADRASAAERRQRCSRLHRHLRQPMSEQLRLGLSTFGDITRHLPVLPGPDPRRET
jgi:uncharacterized membrane protein